MYVIFIHISGIALIEILFYFFYIGKMETQMFINNINHLLHVEQNKIDYTMYNGSLIEYNNSFIDYYEQRAQYGEDSRNRDNFHLLGDSLLGFIVILAITIIVTLIETYKNNKITKVSSMDSVRNICIEMTEYSPTHTNTPQQQIFEETSKNKIYVIILHIMTYTGLLIAFEYWFFNCIVMRYKVISNEEIEYLFAQQIT